MLFSFNTDQEIIVATETSVPLAAKALNTISTGINKGSSALVEVNNIYTYNRVAHNIIMK